MIATSGSPWSTRSIPAATLPAVPTTSMPVSAQHRDEPLAQGLVVVDDHELGHGLVVSLTARRG